MSQVLTFLAGLFRRRGVRVNIRLDHSGVGAHLIWTIVNGEPEPLEISSFVFRGAHGSSVTIPVRPIRTIDSNGQLVFPIDVDWNLLGAREIAVADADGREYAPPRRQLSAVQDVLRQAIDRRRAMPSSARDFLAGVADLAFAVVILGLGFFMLMWMIATG